MFFFGAVLFIVLALAQSIELCLIRGQVRPIFDEVLRSQGSTNDATKFFFVADPFLGPPFLSFAELG